MKLFGNNAANYSLHVSVNSLKTTPTGPQTAETTTPVKTPHLRSLLVAFSLLLSALPSLSPAQTVSGTKAAAFPPNNDASARPGDTITYTISVGNAAAAVNNALNVQVADTVDPNSTFVNNSAKVSANAIAHAYNAAGNTQLIVPGTPSGLKVGVTDIDGVTPNASLLVTRARLRPARAAA